MNLQLQSKVGNVAKMVASTMKHSTEKTMRAAVIDEANKKLSSSISWQGGMKVPACDSPYQVLIRVKAAGVNRADIMQRVGRYPPPEGVSDTLGLEVAGEIQECGSAVTTLPVGTKVMALLGGGGYADYVLADAACCMPIPNGLDYVQAAAIPEAYSTAYQCFVVESGYAYSAAAPSPKVLLIHAGASGVGIALAQIARIYGWKVISTCSKDKVNFCSKLADFVVARGDKPFSNEVLDFLTKHGLGGVDLVVDPVFANNYINDDVKCIRKDGKIVIIGAMGGSKQQLDIVQLFSKRATIKFSTLRSQSVEYRSNITRGLSSLINEYYLTGKLNPVIDKVFEAKDVAEAHAYVEANKNIGKVVIKVD